MQARAEVAGALLRLVRREHSDHRPADGAASGLPLKVDRRLPGAARRARRRPRRRRRRHDTAAERLAEQVEVGVDAPRSRVAKVSVPGAAESDWILFATKSTSRASQSCGTPARYRRAARHPASPGSARRARRRFGVIALPRAAVAVRHDVEPGVKGPKSPRASWSSRSLTMVVVRRVEVARPSR